MVPGAVLSSDLTNDMLADTAAGSSLRLNVTKCEHLGRLAHIKHVFNNLNMLPYLRLNIYSKLPHYTPFVTVNGKKVVKADVEATNGVIDQYECLLFPFINWTFQVIHFISDVIYPLPTTNTMADLLSTDERLETVRKKSQDPNPKVLDLVGGLDGGQPVRGGGQRGALHPLRPHQRCLRQGSNGKHLM